MGKRVSDSTELFSTQRRASQSGQAASSSSMGAPINRPARARAGAKVIAEPHTRGRACAAGVHALPPECDIVVFLDSDGSDRPEFRHRLIDTIKGGMHDLVIGPRARGRRELAASMLSVTATPIITIFGTAAGVCTGNVSFNSSRDKSVSISSRA
jgi:hypothetical protein